MTRELLGGWFLRAERDVTLSDIGRTAAERKVEKMLKIEIAGEALGRVYGHKSHPVAVKKRQQVAVRVISQFGEETTKVLIVDG